MSITVRSLQPNPPVDDGDRKIAWIDRPHVGDDVYDLADSFTVDESGRLFVWLQQTTTNAEPLAVYAPGAWYSAWRST